jgi:predicted RNase H-like HicB family nuclease
VAYSNEYPGAVGQGETEEEALKDLEEAIQVLKEYLGQRKNVKVK